MAFLPTIPPLSRALAERNYNDPTPVQSAVLTPEAADRDLLVSAQTGSGKTVAYGLALGSTLMGGSERMEKAAEPLALIVAPTRELALQVHRELSWLYQYAGARVVACVGGMDSRREQRMLADGAHIVVGTPGRLRDHLQRGALNISKLKAVVLDEADEMLDLGFREDLEFILETTPADRRTLLFSATLPKTIAMMAKRFQRDAFRIDVSGGERGHVDIEYRAIRVAPNDIEHAVVNVLRFVESPGALVFCNTRQSVRHLQAILFERGFAAVSLSGELSQSERNQALQALRDGRARVCVATDVAARGIDLPSLGLVIHADLPHDAEVLQHRSGRTGRAGRKGVSVLLVPMSRRRRAEQLLSSAGIKAIWAAPPTPEDIRKLDQERMLHDPLLTEEQNEDDLAIAKALLAVRSAEEIAAALVRVYRARLPAPEEVADPGEGRPMREFREPRERHSSHERTAAAPNEASAPRRTERDASRTRSPGNNVWFRINIGRKKNADPRWLLPMLCRRGNLTRQDIGAIRVFEDETRFEVDQKSADSFAAAVALAKGGDGRIELMSEQPEAGTTERPPVSRPRPPQPHSSKPDGSTPDSGTPDGRKPYVSKPYLGKKPHRENSHDGKPRDAKPYAGKPQDRKPYGDKPHGEAPHHGKPPHRGKSKRSKPFREQGKPT